MKPHWFLGPSDLRWWRDKGEGGRPFFSIAGSTLYSQFNRPLRSP